MKFIKELYEGDKEVSQFLIGNVTKATASMSGASYLNVELRDNSGTMMAKKWEVNLGDEEIIVPGNIVQMEVEISKYKDNLQAKILSASRLEESKIDVTRFIKQPPVSQEELLVRLNKCLSLINNEECKKVIEYFKEKFKDKLYLYPAAVSIHHEYQCGLLMHTTSMLEIADALCDRYECNRDLLLTGIFLHDIGKTIEFEGPIVFHYSKEGKLLGHITIMTAEVREACKTLSISEETSLLLQHMVASHHGQLDFGSPVLPQTKEALLISFIDNLDSKMTLANKALDEVEVGEFTSKVYALDNRTFYKHK